jgi:hypothetical protein
MITILSCNIDGNNVKLTWKLSEDIQKVKIFICDNPDSGFEKCRGQGQHIALVDKHDKGVSYIYTLKSAENEGVYIKLFGLSEDNELIDSSGAVTGKIFPELTVRAGIIYKHSLLNSKMKRVIIKFAGSPDVISPKALRYKKVYAGKEYIYPLNPEIINNGDYIILAEKDAEIRLICDERYGNIKIKGLHNG